MPASDWVVCIPSYGRPDVLVAKTLPTLQRGHVPGDRIYVYLSDWAEAEAYAAAVAPLAPLSGAPACTLREGAPGLAANRNVIVRDWPAGTNLVMMDDDLGSVDERVTSKLLRPVGHLPALFAEAFRWCEMSGAWLWGVYPVRNAMFMRPQVRTDLRFISGGLFGIRLRHWPCELTDVDHKEDHERTLKFYATDGTVVRLDGVAMGTSYRAGKGGMAGLPGRTEADAARTEELAKLYPELCTAYWAKRGTAELRFKDRRR